MIKYCINRWNEKYDEFKKYLLRQNYHFLENCEYLDLLKTVFDKVLNGDNLHWKLEYITSPNNFDYSGEEVFLIPADAEKVGQTLVTYVFYGSCAGCDVLMRAQDDLRELKYLGRPLTEDAILPFIEICKDFIVNMRAPFNEEYTWRYCKDLEEVDSDKYLEVGGNT